jgi:hypothetical protein
MDNKFASSSFVVILVHCPIILWSTQGIIQYQQITRTIIYRSTSGISFFCFPVSLWFPFKYTFRTTCRSPSIRIHIPGKVISPGTDFLASSQSFDKLITKYVESLTIWSILYNFFCRLATASLYYVRILLRNNLKLRIHPKI